MSQDNQNSQPPSSSRPYQRDQPFWKVKTVQILRGTIAILEATVVKLETSPPPDAEATPGFWGGILAKIRSVLPANLSGRLSDTALTGVLAAIAVILVWTTTTVFGSQPTEVATIPPVEEIPTPTPTPTPTESVTPEPTPTAEITPPVIETPPLPELEPTLEPTPEPTPELTPEPTPEPKPAIELTPEQTLIAAIENQVAAISDRFTNGLIKSIQANFRTSNLTVKISDDWYTIEKSQQDKLAAEILQRSQELDFSHLELVDSQSKLIARNPVVGNEMVIFRRQVTAIRD